MLERNGIEAVLTVGSCPAAVAVDVMMKKTIKLGNFETDAVLGLLPVSE